MYGAIILALLSSTNWQDALRPSEAEVQAAMSARWVMISSIGDDNRDYAVRNVTCGKSEPIITEPKAEDSSQPSEQSGGIAAKILFQRRDIYQFTVRCSFEAASVPRRSRKPRKLEFGKGVPRIFSKRALKRIAPSAWQKENHVFVYVSRGHCMLMGRTPEPGECHNWFIDNQNFRALP